MEKVRTSEEFLTDIILGKIEKPVCRGYPDGYPNSRLYGHDPAEYELRIHDRSYFFGCPVCGFGQAGGLREEDAKKLKELAKSRSLSK